MLSNKLFSFKPVVIFFFPKRRGGGRPVFLRTHFISLRWLKKKKMAMSWSLEAGAQSSCRSYPATSKIRRNVALAGLKQERESTL